MIKCSVVILSLLLGGAVFGANPQPLFDMDEMRDPDTLAVKVLQDWKVIRGPVPTRQKLITIRVGELAPGEEYRVPVRLVVPEKGKAKGFHLSGSNNPKGLQLARPPRGPDVELIRGGVGVVKTVVQEPGSYGEGQLAGLAQQRFFKTLDPSSSIQYWGWPAVLMRATTAAYAEKEHFTKGKVLMSGASKNGASPSVALIHDERLTAVYAGVSPIWDSPLRLCDKKAWDALRKSNSDYAKSLGADRSLTTRLSRDPFLGGTYGPVYNRQAMERGNSWEDLQTLASKMADQVFVSRNLKQLKKRGVDMFFHPGTHDFVCFDLAWGGKHHPQVPLYLRVNSGHSKNARHPGVERIERNQDAFILNHFLGLDRPMLQSPEVKAKRVGDQLEVGVSFPKGSGDETGRIFWMFDRYPDGSAAYVREDFPHDQWKDMKRDPKGGGWTVAIDPPKGASQVDFFSNHRKTLHFKEDSLPTYRSSPYTRVEL
jgi:hypothetical protein